MDLKKQSKKQIRPITTAELFSKICGILEDGGRMPDDILDYRLATNSPVPIKTYEFAIRNNLDYGSNEGIYLDLWIEFYEDNEKQLKELGTFKTLLDSKEAMCVMARLLADFIVEERKIVNANLDDFTWTGIDVYPIGMNGVKINYGYSCATMEKALIRKDELLQKCPCVVVRDNATRKEECYMRKGA